MRSTHFDAIATKARAGLRLDDADALHLFEEPDFLALGALANEQRERRHGDRTYFNRNIRLETTNVCVASCNFCSFAKLEAGMPGAHTMNVEQAVENLKSRIDLADPPSEVHIVNGLN
ncbi:MAG: aminofutalosine synthase MqnE, partial [Polyangiales bacterium]